MYFRKPVLFLNSSYSLIVKVDLLLIGNFYLALYNEYTMKRVKKHSTKSYTNFNENKSVHFSVQEKDSLKFLIV